jgi:CRP/FNR family transcriptional regulator, polysaccharide utilization system transcription regulator
MKEKHSFYSDCVSCEMRHRSLFCNLSTAELEKFDSAKRCSFHRKGDIIFREGGTPNGVYAIHSGKIKVAHVGNDGKEQIVRMVREADLLGYRAMLSNQPYNATATALTDVEICHISKETFLQVLKNNSAFSLMIIQKLSEQLGNSERIITDLAQKSVRERLAEALLFLHCTYGFEADNATLNISLSREDLANYIGTATETTIRLLSEFKHDEIVAFDGRKIKIKDFNKLVRTANVYN